MRKIILSLWLLGCLCALNAFEPMDSVPVGIEKSLRLSLPGLTKLKLRPVIGSQPVTLRIWGDRTDSGVWHIAWTGMQAGTYNLTDWLDLPDSFSALPVMVSGTMTDSDDGALQNFRNPWQEEFRFPGYSVLVVCFMILWVLLLPLVALIRHQLYPPLKMKISTPPKIFSSEEKAEVYLSRLSELNAEEQAILWFLLMDCWCEQLGISGSPESCCLLVGKSTERGDIYRSVEAWMFRPDAPLPDIVILRESLRTECQTPKENVNDL